MWLAVNAPREARFPFRSPEAIERRQRRRLAATVSFAFRRVPHYRQTLDRLGLGPADISSAGDLARLPILERTEVQVEPERFVADPQSIERYVPLMTGGSTGVPLTIYHDQFSLIQQGAHHQRAWSIHRRLAGCRCRCRRLRIGHAPAVAMGPIDQVFAALRKLVGIEVRLASILQPVERGVEELNLVRPAHPRLPRLLPRRALRFARCHRPTVPQAGASSSTAATRCQSAPGT